MPVIIIFCVRTCCKDTDTEKPENFPADSEAVVVEEFIKRLPSLEELKTLDQKKKDAAYRAGTCGLDSILC